MDQLQSMRVFVRVAQHAGFAAAARELRMSPAAVTKHVASLESRIGARLFDRTTRKVSLTEAGRVYLERCLECLQAFEDADASVSELANEPRGVLRVSAPIDFGKSLAPVIAEVMLANPSLVIDLFLSNRVVDLVEERIDVSVRVATGLDGRFVARPIATTRLTVVGAPEYLRAHGRPRKPQDLGAHRSLVFSEPRPMDQLTFARGQKQVRVKLSTVMTSNNGAALGAAARDGVGLALLPSFLLDAEDLETGRLEPLLLDWSLPELRIFAVYPHRRFLSPKVRTFVDALRAAFGDGSRDPWWPEELASRAKPSARAATPGSTRM